MNSIAIISQGKSAKLYDESMARDFDAVIGVNWTVTKWRCDWWCFCDFVTYEKHVPLGDPAIFTNAAQVAKIESQLIGKAHQRLTEAMASGRLLKHEEADAPVLPPGMVPWASYSGPAALVLARHLGAQKITAFGVDMTGDGDFSGKTSGTRSEKRWKVERELWEALHDRFRFEGIMIERVVGGLDA
jgi:hypothetical protein